MTPTAIPAETVESLEAALVAMTEDDFHGPAGDAARARLAAIRPRRSAAAIAADYAGEVRCAAR